MTLDHSTVTHVAHSTPYAWPWDGDLSPRGTAALVVEPRGAGPALSGGGSGVASAVVEITTTLRAAGGTVIRVLTAPPLHSPEVSGQLELALETDFVVSSAGIDGFFGSQLDAVLRRLAVQRLILVGLGLETCVHSTMRTANDMGYECLLVVDACLPYQTSLVAQSVSMIEMSGGIFGAVGFAADVVEAFTGYKGEKL